MPRNKKTASREFSREKRKNESRIKWGESYTSLLLGVIVVVVAFFLVFSIIKARNYNLGTTSSTNTEDQEMMGNLPKDYVVKAGEDLWKISEKIYGSGYNWTDLATANKITNPSVIHTGTKLVVPNVKAKTVEVAKEAVETENNKITTEKYTIQKGDCLWTIAVKAYGDGYRWVDLAKANKLTNPDLIHSDNVLIIPR